MSECPIRIPLKNLQTIFKQNLMGSDDSIAGHIVSTPELATETRLGIYQNAYVARLVESLEQDYPSLLAALGEDQFTDLCRQYIQQHPSRFTSLRYFGQHMPDFILNTKPWCDQRYLHELAVLEWCFIEAFDSENAVVATEKDIVNIAPENWPQLKIVLHPSVHWFEYRWNSLPMWKASSQQAPLPEPVSLDEIQYCLVWRRELSTQYRTMQYDEVLMMQQVARERTFADVCEALAQYSESSQADPNQVPMRAASIIKTWLSEGVISQFSID